jgi:amino acid permease
LKKELAELKWLTFVLFGSVGIFILCNLYLLCLDKNFTATHEPGFKTDVWLPNHGFVRLISALSITLVAYGYQSNIYPIYCNLKEKSNKEYMKVNNYGLLLTVLIYIIVVFISIAMFGSNISSVILENIGTLSFVKNG